MCQKSISFCFSPLSLWIHWNVKPIALLYFQLSLFPHAAHMSFHLTIQSGFLVFFCDSALFLSRFNMNITYIYKSTHLFICIRTHLVNTLMLFCWQSSYIYLFYNFIMNRKTFNLTRFLFWNRKAVSYKRTYINDDYP